MRLSYLGTAVALSTACTSIQSSSIKTSGMSASMQVVADGTGQTTASATLNVGSNSTDFVDLSSGDVLVATAGARSQPMARIDALSVISYRTSFNGLDTDGMQYTIALNRANDVGAPSSICVLPKPFNVTAPTGNGIFSRANSDITVTYDNVGTQDSMTWSIGGGCVKGLVGGNVAGDTGSFTIAKGTLVPVGASQSGVTCQAQITLTRARSGQVDAHFGSGGAITAMQVRTVTFNSAP